MVYSKSCLAAGLVAAGAVAVAAAISSLSPAVAQSQGEIARASFNEDGSVNQPVNWPGVGLCRRTVDT
jgi:hypothetical protein